MGTRGGQKLTSTFPEGVFTDQLSGTRDKRFQESFTDVPILQRTTGDKLTIGSRPVTEKEIISVPERDAMAQRLKDRLLKLDLGFLPKKLSTPLEVGQKIIKLNGVKVSSLYQFDKTWDYYESKNKTFTIVFQ